MNTLNTAIKTSTKTITKTRPKTRPIVFLPADIKQIGLHPFNAVGHKYVLAVAQAAQATPLLIPAISEYLDLDAILAMADGILLTGSVSNLHPSHFNQAVHDESLPLDPARDALTLELIRKTIDAGVPLLAICRGFQEINVAYGGSLHQAVHDISDLYDHRAPNEESAETQYAEAHRVNLAANGKLAKIVGLTSIMVNSIHGQGLDRLALGLTVEATAPDGLVEAISVDSASAFALGVQWHPEWQVMQNPAYLAIFKAFGEACKARMLRRIPPD
ncbi:MAG: gamma-glutamyl-gamma-aminobutyrate hydrolase family protein [Bdellovibrio sp.]|nr:gamma-glutamyl-gamma-aminobutyrate hydrolase family protein [Methylotenera sp.]